LGSAVEIWIRFGTVSNQPSNRKRAAPSSRARLQHLAETVLGVLQMFSRSPSEGISSPGDAAAAASLSLISIWSPPSTPRRCCRHQSVLAPGVAARYGSHRGHVNFGRRCHMNKFWMSMSHELWIDVTCNVRAST
jgi:hypothetical protein